MDCTCCFISTPINCVTFMALGYFSLPFTSCFSAVAKPYICLLIFNRLNWSVICHSVERIVKRCIPAVLNTSINPMLVISSESLMKCPTWFKKLWMSFTFFNFFFLISYYKIQLAFFHAFKFPFDYFNALNEDNGEHLAKTSSRM